MRVLQVINSIPWALVFLVLYAASEVIGRSERCKYNTVYQYVAMFFRLLAGR